LKYLAMSGRVGKIAAGMANMLNIRPILTIRDGKLDMLERVRTKRVAMQRLVELVVTSVGSSSVERVAFIHVNNLEDTNLLETELRKQLSLPEEVLKVEFTPGLSVHAGDGLVGVAIVTVE
ncbi:MAG: DegV family protein, partial [Anaerolineales bacterium]